MNRRIFLLSILLIGAVLRFYQLGEIPLGFHRDEAFLTYNAFSILKTGYDISGNFLPLHLQSFLYSPAGYSYFSIPFIFLFDLSEFSARFASAFFGFLTIIISYLLVIELFFSRKEKYLIALITSFLISISPWNIILSRTSTENVIVVFFISLGVYLFLCSLRKNNNYLTLLSFIPFFLTLFTYQAPRSFLPIFVPVLSFIYLYKRVDVKKTVILFFCYLILIILPVFYVMFSPELSLRLKTLNVFYSEKTRANLGESFRRDGIDGRPLVETGIFHNKITGYFQEISHNYFAHLSFSFLFTDEYFPDRYRIPSSGLLYFIEFPLLLIGLFEILKKKNKVGILLISWILIAPIGASLTFDDVPNMQRTLLFFPALSIISALGIVTLINYSRKNRIVISLLSLIILYSTFGFLHQYFVDGKYYRPWYRQEGYKELVKKVNELLPDYKYAVITNRETAPTIFFLFYNQYDPEVFQKESKDKNKEDTDSINFEKYVFSNHECPLRTETDDQGKTELFGEKDILYINSGLCNDQEELSYLGLIRRKDGSTAFKLAEYRDGDNK